MSHCFLPMIFSEKWWLCQTKVVLQFSRISCYQQHYLNLAFHNIFFFLFYIIHCRNFFVFYKILNFYLSYFFTYLLTSSDFFIIVFLSTFVIQGTLLALSRFHFTVVWIFSISKNICSKCLYSFICWFSLSSSSLLKITLSKFCSLYKLAL